MNDPVAAAAALGLRVRVQDFGAAARAIAAEYDPPAATIRINARALDGARDPRGVIAACVAHEIYHHLEFLGRVPREGGRAEREARADAFARRRFRLAVDPSRIRAELSR